MMKNVLLYTQNLNSIFLNSYLLFTNIGKNEIMHDMLHELSLWAGLSSKI